MAKHFKDFYGCSATIWVNYDGSAHLVIYNRQEMIVDKYYNSFRGAKIAMGKYSDGWYELKGV